MLCVNQSIVTLILQVDSVRSQCNDRINKLTSEVHALEMVSILASINNVVLEKANEYDQEMPQPHSADQTHGTVRKRHRKLTVTRQLSLFPGEMIAKLEITLSAAQQIVEKFILYDKMLVRF